MSKLALTSLSCLMALVVGCAAPSSQSTGSSSQGATGSQTMASTSNAGGSHRSMYVPPPVGSLLGGGYVRVAEENVQGNDEDALIGTISQLNAAAGSVVERPYVISAISKSTGVSTRELQAQQDLLRLRFGELCAINAIARGDSNKVQQIATLKAHGQSWTQLASSHGVSIATVVQTARNAHELTVANFSNNAERTKGANDKLRNLGVHPQSPPNN